MIIEDMCISVVRIILTPYRNDMHSIFCVFSVCLSGEVVEIDLYSYKRWLRKKVTERNIIVTHERYADMAIYF